MIYTVIIPLALLVAPWLVVRFLLSTSKTRLITYRQSFPYLVATAGLWVVANVVPNIPVSDDTQTFSMHLTGGVVAAILFVYAVKAYGWSFLAWWQSWVGLFCFVSGLGVLNELFEFFLDEIGYPGMVLGDERWDLLANTIGALVGFSVYQIALIVRHRYNAKRMHP